MIQFYLKRLCAALLIIGLSSAAAVQAASKIDALAEGNPDLAKMAGKLLEMRQDVKSGDAPSKAFKRADHAIRNGKLQVIIGVKEISKDLIEACADAGLTVVGTYDHPDIGLHNVVVQCTSPLQLDALAARSDVRGITPEPKAIVWTGSVDNQADVSINADDARTNLGVDGSGIRVGVLSDSINDTLGGTISGGFLTGAAPQTSGDLPASIRVIDAGPGSSTDEGAGMGELIYDLAPGCDISFASATSSYAAFASNITALRSDATAPADVIVDDVGYPAEPFYQDGPIALAARDCGVNNVPYFSACGNSADAAHEEDYSDISGTDDTNFPPSGNDLHDFGVAKGGSSDTHIEVSVVNGGSLTVVLHWDEPYGGTLGAGPGSEADLDVYILNSSATPVTLGMVAGPQGASTEAQGTVGSPSGEPIEIAAYFNSSGSTQTVYVAVEHYDGREPVLLHLMLLTRGATVVDSNLLGDRTVWGHPAASDVIGVAAMFYGEIDGGGALEGGPELNVESFSSLGSTSYPILFSEDGNTRLGSPITREKPEIAAPDGTNTTFFPPGGDIPFDADSDPNFFGTSAAAPHAAAVAALMLEYNSALSASDVYDIMRDTAIDAETPGLDSLSGSGLIDAEAAVSAASLLNAKEWTLYF